MLQRSQVSAPVRQAQRWRCPLAVRFFVPPFDVQLAAGNPIGFTEGAGAECVFAQRVERGHCQPLESLALAAAPLLESLRCDDDVGQKRTAIERGSFG